MLIVCMPHGRAWNGPRGGKCEEQVRRAARGQSGWGRASCVSPPPPPLLVRPLLRRARAARAACLPAEMAGLNAIARTLVRLLFGASLMHGSVATAMEHFRQVRVGCQCAGRRLAAASSRVKVRAWRPDALYRPCRRAPSAGTAAENWKTGGGATLWWCPCGRAADGVHVSTACVVRVR